jgi:hypothetical protein
VRVPEPAVGRRGLVGQRLLRRVEALGQQPVTDDVVLEEAEGLDLGEPGAVAGGDVVRLERLLLVALPPRGQLAVDLREPGLLGLGELRRRRVDRLALLGGLLRRLLAGLPVGQDLALLADQGRRVRDRRHVGLLGRGHQVLGDPRRWW